MHKNVEEAFNRSQNCIWNLNMIYIESHVSKFKNRKETSLKTHVCEKYNKQNLLKKTILSHFLV